MTDDGQSAVYPAEKAVYPTLNPAVKEGQRGGDSSVLSGSEMEASEVDVRGARVDAVSGAIMAPLAHESITWTQEHHMDAVSGAMMALETRPSAPLPMRCLADG